MTIIKLNKYKLWKQNRDRKIHNVISKATPIRHKKLLSKYYEHYVLISRFFKHSKQKYISILLIPQRRMKTAIY